MHRSLLSLQFWLSLALGVCCTMGAAAKPSAAEPAAAASRAAAPLRIIAHRGASHDAPENTCAAFRLAWEQAADGIEGDFRLTKDGEIVCLHDADTARVAGEQLLAKEATLAELRRLDVGAKKHARFRGERIPTFAEVAALVPPKKLFFIELKVGPEIVAPLAKQLVASSLQPEQIVIISFDARTLAECKRQLPDIRTHWLTGFNRPKGDQDWARGAPTAATVAKTLAGCRADGLGAQGNDQQLTAPFLQALREAGLREFHVWTVDQPVLARRFLSLGAWSLTTNRPAYLRQELARPAEKAP